MSFELDTDSKHKILCDRYYLHNVITQSNYSRIFLATDLALDYRRCAIKQLYPRYCPRKMQAKIETEFLREVGISQQIAGIHPQLCQHYNYMVDSGNQYLVQEWIEGTTLREKLQQQKKFTESETQAILSSILIILERLHDLKIVHNDLKPSNIILRSKDKLPVLIDFGISRRIGKKDHQKSIVGTPGYMSLEQAMGKTSYNNDLYSLGLIAIYLLTGKSPQSINFNSGLDNFWNQTKDFFDTKLAATIDRAIAPRPEKRFSSATEMLAMLQGYPKQLVWRSTYIKQAKIKSKYWNYLNLGIIAILLMSGMWWLYLSYFKSSPTNEPSLPITDWAENELLTSPPIEESTQFIQPTITEIINNSLQKVIFFPGTDAEKILQTLGEPLWRKPGFWANSIAWSYEDVIETGIDLGYIFDRQTLKLRQAEIAVPPQTHLSTLQLAMNSFLAVEQSTIDIKQGLEAVYRREKKIHTFRTENLKGIIQRNDRDRIYLAVWSADFH